MCSANKRQDHIQPAALKVPDLQGRLQGINEKVEDVDNNAGDRKDGMGSLENGDFLLWKKKSLN